MGILDNEENPTTDSDRVKAQVIGAGPTDFFFFFFGGVGAQKHVVANQAGVEGVDRLVLTASQKTSKLKHQMWILGLLFPKLRVR